MCKDILVLALLGKIEEAAMQQALILAGKSSGKVTALVAASYLVSATGGWASYREGTDPGAFPSLEAAGQAWLQRYVDDAEKRLQAESVEHEVKGVEEFWLTPAEICIRNALAFDLIVLGVCRPVEREQAKLFAGVLAGCGRPILLVPSTFRARAFNHVVVAWKSTREAAVALRDAMPMLKQARTVEVVVAGTTNDTHALDPANDVIEHLRLHEVPAHLVRLPSADAATGWTIGDHALRAGADLVVSGGYSHPRALEQVFGGVTQYFLNYSQIPFLLSH